MLRVMSLVVKHSAVAELQKLCGVNLTTASVSLLALKRQVLDWNGGEANSGEVRKRSKGEKPGDVVRTCWRGLTLSSQRPRKAAGLDLSPPSLDNTLLLRNCPTCCAQVPVVGSGHKPGGEGQGQDSGGWESLL